MLGGKNKQSPGYTIVEVMIVLAISGVMFLIAAIFVQGKQQKTSFRAGVNDFASTIQDVIEQVTDGRYSDVQLGQCLSGPSGTTFLSGSSFQQGTNANCVFWGKLLYFQKKSAGYSVLPLVGGRLDPSKPSLTFPQNAYPVAPTALRVDQTIPDQLTVAKITPAYAIGFIQSQGTTAQSGGAPSGAQSVNLYYVNTAGGTSAYNNDYAEGSTVLARSLNPAVSADICVTDGTEYAEITLGQAGGQLSANISMDGTTPPSSGNCS